MAKRGAVVESQRVSEKTTGRLLGVFPNDVLYRSPFCAAHSLELVFADASLTWLSCRLASLVPGGRRKKAERSAEALRQVASTQPIIMHWEVIELPYPRHGPSE